MTVTVGLRRDERGRGALHLAAMLARSTGDHLVACTVVPAPWPAGMARVDAEYQEYLDRTAGDVLDRAREALPPDLTAEYVVARARSAPVGLLDVAGERGADLLASCAAGARRRRSRAEAGVVHEWSADVERAQRAALAQVARLPRVPAALDAVVGHGPDWAAALEDVEWADGDILVVGSSSVGPVARVFLGSRSSKIVRNSPVPVVAVPRGTAEELADRAEQGEETDRER